MAEGGVTHGFGGVRYGGPHSTKSVAKVGDKVYKRVDIQRGTEVG